MIRDVVPFSLALLLAACGGETEAPRAADAGASRDYAAPPRPTSVTAGPGGRLVVSGAARPDARVRLVAYGGDAYGAQADAQGAFRFELPASGQPRLLALSVEADGREVEGDGWLFAPPDRPERAVMLRPGSAALPVSGGARLALVSVDYDAGGGVAVAGTAPPNAEVLVLVDGRPAARGPASVDGRFAFRLAPEVTPGTHTVQLGAGGERQAYEVRFAPPPPAGALSVRSAPEGWRVEWPTSGGGAQATLVLGGGPGA